MEGCVTDNNEYIVFAPHDDVLREFIETYENLPVLWNTSHPFYMHKMKRNSALKKLENIYRKIKPGANRADVRRKINTLRSNFRKEMKRVVTSMESECSADEVYQPASWVFHSLKFLNNCEQTFDADVQMNEDEESEIRPPISQASSVPMVAVASRVQPTKPSRCTEKEDEFDIVGRRVAYQLRGMEEHQSLIAEKLVSDVMFQGRIGKLDENSFICLFPPNSSVSKLL